MGVGAGEPVVGCDAVSVGVGGADEIAPVKAKRFAVPDGTLCSWPSVAPPMIAEATCDGVALGNAARYKAATPATCGEAIEVPLFKTELVSSKL